MAQPPLKFFVNTSAEDYGFALVSSFTNGAPPPAACFSLVDSARPAAIHFLAVNPLSPDATGANPFIYVTPPDSAELSVGEFDLPVQAGTFSLTESAGAQTASAIPFNESAAALQTALRAAWSTNFSACVVSGDTGGPWVINRGANGTYSGAITGNTAAITPPNSQIEVSTLQSGTANRPAIFEITLLQPPAILGTLSGSLPAASAVPSSKVTGTSSVNAVQNIIWNADAIGGAVQILGSFPVGGGLASQSIANPTVVTTVRPHGLPSGRLVPVTISGTSTTPTTNGDFTATITGASTFTIPVNVSSGGTGGAAVSTASVGPIPYNATAADFTAVLVQHPATNSDQTSYGVTQNGPGDYDITFMANLGLQAVTTISATQSLKVPIGLSGTINCRTSGVQALLGTASSVTTNLQITQTTSGVESDAASADNAILRNDLSPSGAISSNPLEPSGGFTSLRVTGIDAKATGATLIGTTAPGATFHAINVVVECTADSSITVACQLSIGTNATNFDNVLGITTQTGVTSTGKYLDTRIASVAKTVVAAGTDIKVNITTGATGTSQTISVTLFGFYS